MAYLVGISGPSCTGKSKLIELLDMQLQESQINKMSYYVARDIKDKVWNDLVSSTSISQWEEVYNDSDILLMYCFKMLKAYEEVVNELKNSTFDFCIIDTTYIDLLIYFQLHFWFHYPVGDLLSEMVERTLSLQDSIDKIFMTVTDDENFDYEQKDLRQRMSDFRRNRRIEKLYYDIYRRLPNVESISSPVEFSVSHIVDVLKRKEWEHEQSDRVSE